MKSVAGPQNIKLEELCWTELLKSCIWYNCPCTPVPLLPTQQHIHIVLTWQEPLRTAQHLQLIWEWEPAGPERFPVEKKVLLLRAWKHLYEQAEILMIILPVHAGTILLYPHTFLNLGVIYGTNKFDQAVSRNWISPDTDRVKSNTGSSSCLLNIFLPSYKNSF